MGGLQMNIVYALTTIGVVCLLCTGTGVLAEPCGGNNHRPHDRGPYKFKTSSWVRAGDNGHYYRTCVENLSARDLWFDWFTPGPTTYIPPSESVTSPRYFIDRKSADFQGCIQYGNHREPMEEYFIGHENDREQISKEKTGGCKIGRHAAQSAASPADSSKIEYVTTLFMPSDSERVRDTMMRFDLTVALERRSEAVASSVVRYKATRYYENSKADPTRLTMQTNSEILRAALVKADFKEGRPRLTGFTGEVSVNLPLPKRFVIENARYTFLDQNGILVGAVFVPVPKAQ